MKAYLPKQEIDLLPEEFKKRIEHDLNTISHAIPDYLVSKETELFVHWDNPDMLHFLIGFCIGNCEGSYVQAFQQVYGKVPSRCQISEIHKIIARRRSQIEHGVIVYLKEKDYKFFS